APESRLQDEPVSLEFGRTKEIGRGGIRTHGGFPHARFRVECLKPDSATLPQSGNAPPITERPTSRPPSQDLRTLGQKSQAALLNRIGLVLRRTIKSSATSF